MIACTTENSYEMRMRTSAIKGTDLASGSALIWATCLLEWHCIEPQVSKEQLRESLESKLRDETPQTRGAQ
jgi:hypothetical protein